MQDPIFFLFSLAILAIFIKNIVTWVYVYQLKEFRADRIRDYFSLPEGRRAAFSVGNLIEAIIFLYLVLDKMIYISMGAVWLWIVY